MITLAALVETARATMARDQARLAPGDLAREVDSAGLRGRPPGRLAAALRGSGIRIIAEVKGASPVAGTLRADLRPVDLATSYAAAGASAISVLTEERHFGGSLAHLREVAAAVSVPVLRKDFVVDPYQVEQAALAGAAGVLLIADVLGAADLAALVETAHRVGLDALVEVHGAVSIAAAVAAGSGIIGVNNRNLETMAVDWRHSLDLVSCLPSDVVRVAESGIESSEQLVRLGAAGYDAALIGTSLVRSPDPAAALRRLLAADAAVSGR